MASELPPASGGRRPGIVNLREIVNAIFYRLRTGCPWENVASRLSTEIDSVRDFIRWRNDGTWERLHDA